MTDTNQAPPIGPSPLRLRTTTHALPPQDKAWSDRVQAQLIDIDGGVFDMGSEDADVVPGDDEGPIRAVDVGAFRIGATAVTNADFERFVSKTRYVTDAEKYGWSFVFHLFTRSLHSSMLRGTAGGTPWWVAVNGATWHRPDGPGSSLRNRRDHPVVHVSHRDALAYCAWSGSRLPTEAEWEYAARGGLRRKRYPWGDDLAPGGRHMCNIWQGIFPTLNSGEDGFLGTSPARYFDPNGFGLYNVAGNVWEWTSTPWRDPSDDLWAIRGGSYLCHDSYCNRYRVAARTRNTGDSSSGNTGFRIAAESRQITNERGLLARGRAEQRGPSQHIKSPENIQSLDEDR